MNSLEVRYFAILKELANCESEVVTLTHEKTYADLYQTLSHKYHFPLSIELIQVAVNDEFDDLENFIKPGSRVVFIPPVAGG